MQIVIDIDELYYIGILEGISKQPDETVCTHALYEAVKKGKPLPKCHGDLIDRDALDLKAIDTANHGSNFIRMAKAIVKAQKERSE